MQISTKPCYKLFSVVVVHNYFLPMLLIMGYRIYGDGTNRDPSKSLRGAWLPPRFFICVHSGGGLCDRPPPLPLTHPMAHLTLSTYDFFESINIYQYCNQSILQYINIYGKLLIYLITLTVDSGDRYNAVNIHKFIEKIPQSYTKELHNPCSVNLANLCVATGFCKANQHTLLPN